MSGIGEIIAATAEERKEKNLNMIHDAQEIGTIKELRKFLCDDAVPRGHKGLPRVSRCRKCGSQCGYGKRLIVLMGERVKEDAQMKTEQVFVAMDEVMRFTEKEDDTLRTVRLTKSQCINMAEFIEMHLLDAIRSDVDIDNVNWVADMVGAMRTLKEAGA